MRAARDQEPIDTWRRMKDELKGKYVPPWTSGTDTLKATNRRRSAWKSLMSSSSDATPLTLKGKLIMSRFRAGLREDLRTELLAREITELEIAYALV